MMNKMPVLFIGHGSPMNIISDNSFTRDLATLGKKLPKPKAILVISAHWLTDGTFVTCMDKPETIYDFYGFPDELYQASYPCPGAPDQAQQTINAFRKTRVTCGQGWGIDHGAWSFLKHLYPHADIPTYQLSIDYAFNDPHPKPLSYHYDLAAELAGLRDKGVLIIGSGNIVHNLGRIDFEHVDAPVYSWAREFDESVKQCLLNRDHENLIHYQKLGETSRLAVPTLDHYLPMIYVLALQEKNELPTFVHESFQHASISMRCFQIG